MKTLTVKQPWAYLICAGIKDIENRTWKCPQKYIGQRVLIHASAKPIVNGDCISHWLTKDQYKTIAFDTKPDKQLDTCFLEHYNSAIIGSVAIVDCVINHHSIWAEKTPVTKLYDKWQKPIYNWVLDNPVLFDKPILEVKGKLSFWEYPGIKEAKIECPNCGSHEIAIEDYTTIPFPTYLHECGKCGYMIMESEWNG